MGPGLNGKLADHAPQLVAVGPRHIQEPVPILYQLTGETPALKVLPKLNYVFKFLAQVSGQETKMFAVNTI